MHPTRSICGLIALLCLVGIPGRPGPARAQGNAFLPPAGGATIAVSHTYESYDEFWAGDTQVSDPGLGRVQTSSVTVWMQAGLLDDLAIAANFAYVDVHTDGLSGLQDKGLQDRAFLLRYRFLDRERNGWRHSLVAGGGLRLPAADYEPNRPVALGDGTKDVLLRIVYQIQIDSFWGTYFAVEGGFDARDSTAPDAMSLQGELGATFRRLSLAATLQGSWADGGSDIGDPGFTYPGLNEEWIRLGGNAHYRISPTFGLAFSGFAVLDGRNTGRSRGASTSFVIGL